MKNLTRIAAIAAIVALSASCCQTKSGLNPKDFESEYNGKPTALYVLTNTNGMEVCVTNFGARIVSITVPDKNGKPTDVVLGFETIQEYFPETNDSNFGAFIGRYGNRIANGKFSVAGVEYQLPQNNYGHCLHGGPTGFHYQVCDVLEADSQHIKLQYVSPDGDNGFPGTVTACITYTLTEDNALDLFYEAETDAETVINLTNHSYFNLSGDPANHLITEDILWINAANFTPIDDTFMTTGEIAPVEGTPFDFTEPKLIGVDIEADCEQIRNANGIDHNFVVDNEGSDEIPVVDIICPDNGIEMIMYTSEPGVQVYSGNFLDGTVVGKKGVAYAQRSAICFESQKYPDSPNKADWPSPYVKPGEKYTSHTVYCFAVNDMAEVVEAEEGLEAEFEPIEEISLDEE